MKRQELIDKGLEILKIQDLSELINRYEIWREEVLYYGEANRSGDRLGVLLHVMDTPFGMKEQKVYQYHSCIKKAVRYLQEKQDGDAGKLDALENVIKNFGLYLQCMFQTSPENHSTLKKEILEQMEINNEYDVQHMMYAIVKALYPSARREVNQDMGCGTVRYDIVIKEIDTVIEIKCTRKDHDDRKLCRELGEDGYFYKCSRLIIYVYDKRQKIHDVGNFIKALERTKEIEGKDVRVYVEQSKKLL